MHTLIRTMPSSKKKPEAHAALNRRSLRIAAEALSAADPVLGHWIARAGPCTLLPERAGTHFDAIARSIIHQQLGGRAARAIHDRFNERIGRGGALPTVGDVLRATDDDLRLCGLSGAKTAAIKDLARKIDDGVLPVDRLAKMPDAEITKVLTQVRGIGPWTAQMFLMFRLGRPDVLPVLDLGVRKGAQKIYRMGELPDAARLEKVARSWSPWRSVASWYCWRVLELE